MWNVPFAVVIKQYIPFYLLLMKNRFVIQLLIAFKILISRKIYGNSL